MRSNVIVVGSSNTDMVIKVPRLPLPGETVLGGRFSVLAGGKGANQAVSAARAGGHVCFISKVGRDDFGERSLEGFKNEGIDVSQIKQDPDAPTGVAMIYVNDRAENCIAVAAGANENLSETDIALAGKMIAEASVLVVQLEIPIKTVEKAVKLAAEADVTVILNPAPAQVLSDNILRHVSILTPNETEASLLTGMKVTDNLDAVADKLHRKGVKTVIITLGSRGSFVSSDTFTGLIPAFTVKAIDTTAAGDVFNGALAVGLAEKKPLVDAIQFANAAAALSVMQMGAQVSAPTDKEIKDFLSENLPDWHE
jgi:ribokinase